MSLPIIDEDVPTSVYGQMKEFSLLWALEKDNPVLSSLPIEILSMLNHYFYGKKVVIGDIESITGKRVYYIDEEGNKDGPYMKYVLGGSLEVKSNYVKGKLDGKYEEFYYDGKLKKRLYYKLGVINGPWEYFDSHGRLHQRSEYVEGKLNGETLKYYYSPYDSKVYEDLYTYENNILNGPFSFYVDERKNIKIEGNMVNGNKDGKVREYRRSFDEDEYYLEIELEYKNGLMDGEEIIYSKKGEVKHRRFYKDGVRVK